MNLSVLELLERRRSVSANALGEPGPDEAQLDRLLTIAARVPDHRKLAPWRFILFEGDARARFGKVLAEVCAAEQPDASPGRLETETQRFLRAPVVVGVVSSPRVDQKATPEWEQVLSTGAVCQNLMLAATAMGFGANWITEWYAYSPGVRAALGLTDKERIAGFVYLGTPRETPPDRERPVLADLVRRW